LKKGYIRRSKSEWDSPIVTVKKPNGKIRLCVDFKKVNEVTRSISFYMPLIEEVIEATGSTSVISKLDLAKGYYQVRVRERDRHKTAFVCHRGKFEFNCMPFGVKNAPAIFQTLMDEVLNGMNMFVRTYIDDLIVFSKSWTDHNRHIREVLQALKAAGLTANPEKCQWEGKQF